MPAKPHINMMTAGHVDAGKSTLLGRLLYDSGVIREEEMRKLKELATEMKKETFEFAYALDTTAEERKRGLTIDLMHRPLETKKWYFTVIDAPGHRDFVKNMITGASQADLAVLVVSTKTGEGVQEQTKEHAWLLRVLGVPQIIVVLNKMDTCNFDEKRFNEVKDEVTKLLKGIGYKIEEIPFVPTSGYTGDNVVKKSDNIPWYKGGTLVETLDQHAKEPEKPTDKPLRLPVQDVFTITGIGTVPVGRVETGIIKTNDKIVFMPSGAIGEVKSIEVHHQQIPQAIPGDNVGFNVRGIGKNDAHRGDVVGHLDNPPSVAKEFTAQIVVLQHPTVITAGYTPVFHCHTASVACTITEIIAKIDPKTGAVAQEKPDFIKTGDAARVKVVPTKPFVIEKQSEFPALAKFAVRDMGTTVAAGVCLDLVKAEKA
ncbi:MAG: translation elongation factor EF-1 subunit alpha [Candidatus Aenigmatarchaeota archaeon]